MGRPIMVSNTVLADDSDISVVFHNSEEGDVCEDVGGKTVNR